MDIDSLFHNLNIAIKKNEKLEIQNLLHELKEHSKCMLYYFMLRIFIMRNYKCKYLDDYALEYLIHSGYDKDKAKLIIYIWSNFKVEDKQVVRDIYTEPYDNGLLILFKYFSKIEVENSVY